MCVCISLLSFHTQVILILLNNLILGIVMSPQSFVEIVLYKSVNYSKRKGER